VVSMLSVFSAWLWRERAWETQASPIPRERHPAICAFLCDPFSGLNLSIQRLYLRARLGPLFGGSSAAEKLVDLVLDARRSENACKVHA
jgi:hypothetical protein